jgi:hypothetical protein
MITAHTARKIALGFQETDEKPHFDRIAFRVRGKIFQRNTNYIEWFQPHGG